MSYRKVLPGGIVITSTAPEHVAQLEDLQKIVFPELADSQRLKKEHYSKHIELFPEGQFVAIAGEKVVGMTTSIRLPETFLAADHGFDEVIEGGFCTSHDPTGEWLYGVDVGVHPDYRGHGIARELYRARHDTCRRLGLTGQYSMGMINGFGAVRDAYSLDEYYLKVVAKELFDPTVSMQMKIGFEPRGLAKNYLDDPTCGNACVRLVLPTEREI
jgi:GNAT superfamily N-acetyltransferase